ncbi:MAG: PilZ domain-containing protein [Nitrospiraceae bacterium]|nr:MAG: PilZ domain-containing protein [Nitrospiraceae bacterium]
MKINADLTFNVQGTDKTCKGFCRNLSHTGIQFETAHALSGGQMIEVVLSSKDVRIKPLRALTEVLRVDVIDRTTYQVSGKIVRYK